MNCIQCEVPTSNPKFCSRSCAATFNNKIPKRKIKKQCTQCSSIVRNYKSRLCEKHFQIKKANGHEAFKARTLGWYRSKKCLKKLHGSSIHSHVRGLCRSWLRHLIDKPCASCGYSKFVELCHIKKLTSFGDDALLAEVNSEENVIQLCPNCHWELDHGHITIDQIRK